MSSKREMIEKMLEMQRQFMAYEHENGVAMKDYLVTPEGHPLQGYREDYRNLAMSVVDMAHTEKGSKA